MKCLAANTANALLSVALVDDGKVLHAYETPETRDQGNLLLKHMQEALEKAGLKFQDLDLLAVVTGPGSFTGIRIGLATMRAIAMAANVPVIGISSFELFAAPQEGRVNLVALESWREELYLQAQGRGPVNVAPEDFVRLLAEIPGPYVISGDAAEKLHALLPDAAVSAQRPKAADAARIAMEKFRAGGAGERPVPFYLREADVTVAKAK